MIAPIPPDAKRVVLAAVVSCPTCEGSLSVGEPGYTYYGIPEPGSYEACPDCMDDHGIPTGTRTVITDIEVEPSWMVPPASVPPSDPPVALDPHEAAPKGSVRHWAEVDR